jgi:stress-induced morphogen
VVNRSPVIDQQITMMLRQTMPDAEVRVYDMTGTMDHLEVFVRSKAFAGVSPLNRHRMVEKALAPARADGRIHALQIRTAIPEDTTAHG